MQRSTIGARARMVLAFMLLFGVALAQGTTLEGLRRAVAEQPQNAAAWVQWADALTRDAQWARAKDAYLEAIAIDYLRGDAHFGLGVLEMRRGDLPAALFSFSELARLYSDRFEGHYNQAVVFARLGRFDDAARAFERALQEAEPEAGRSERVNAWTGLGAALLQSGRPVRAAEAFAEALALDPNNRELAFQHANALLAADRGREALVNLTELETRGFDHRIGLTIASIYLAEGQTDRAIRVLERAERHAAEARDPAGQASVWLAMGDLAGGFGRWDDALDAYGRAASLDPMSWFARYAVASTLVAVGEPQRAVQPMLEARALAPDEPQLVLAHAQLMETLQRWPEAVAHANDALALGLDAPSQAAAQALAGRASMQLGAPRTAQTAFDAWLALAPESSEAWLWAGYARDRQGDFQGAVERYQRAIALDPNARVARMNLAGALMALRRFTEAAGVIRLLLQHDARDGSLHHRLAWALHGDGRSDDARASWDEACRLGYNAACRAP